MHKIEPLAVAPKVACGMVGVGLTKLYQLINSGELEVVKIGRATRVKVPSIKRLLGMEDE